MADMEYRIVLALAALFVSVGSVPALAGMTGGGSGDCEKARTNARAGGPTNEYDVETCGCEPGSTNWFCERIAHRQQGARPHNKRRQQRDY
jgi:hypothetical protein